MMKEYSYLIWQDDEDPIVKTLNKKSVKMTDWYNKFKSGGM